MGRFQLSDVAEVAEGQARPLREPRRPCGPPPDTPSGTCQKVAFQPG